MKTSQFQTPTLCMSYRHRGVPHRPKTLAAVSSMQLFTIRYTL